MAETAVHPHEIITGTAHFDNSYARMPDRFFERIAPEKASDPKLLYWNSALAEQLGLNVTALSHADLAQIFVGNTPPQGAETIAMAYAGHQFGGFVPQLGDGRAHLLGEIVTKDGQRYDLQFKGSGRTAFSRMGDGRAALGPVLREMIISEAMHALGVPTTRTLAAVSTGDQVVREEILPGAVLTRVAQSHIRIGTFEYFSARKDIPALEKLTDYALKRHYPDQVSEGNTAIALMQAVLEKQSQLVAQWMQLAFIHGVMNTDNVLISGETIDYGPCAFMDRYDPHTVFSSIDRHGRYAYENQRKIAQWNFACLGMALIPLIDANEEKAILQIQTLVEDFATALQRHWLTGFCQKIGLQQQEKGDEDLLRGLFDLMEAHQSDFTLTFRRLSGAIENDSPALTASFDHHADWTAWRQRWVARLSHEKTSYKEIAVQMDRINPLFIPRNHLVEEALLAANQQQDFSKLFKLMSVLATPYTETLDRTMARYKEAGPDDIPAYRTYCGT